MKIIHYYFDLASCGNAKAIKDGVNPEDIVVVAPAEALLDEFKQLLDGQLNHKKDSSQELLEMRNRFKALSNDEKYQKEVDSTFDRISSILYQAMTRTYADNSLNDYLNAFLVQLCAAAFASLAGKENVVDGRNLIICEHSNGIPVVDWRLTEENAKELNDKENVVVAGTYGRKIQGDTINMGEKGSELTANILGNILKADEAIFLVDGWKYDGDKNLTYEEAAQVFSSGKPVYPPTLLPAKKASMPVSVADPKNLSEKILTISSVKVQDKASGITGVVCSEPMTLFTVYGTGLMGSIGISSAIFGVLAKNGLNIHFISQSSSEYSISFAVKRKVKDEADKALNSLMADKRQGVNKDLTYNAKDVEIVSVFGYGMRNVVGISGKVYGTLGNAGINVIAASQGGEELSISIVVDDKDAETATKVLSSICV